MRVGFVGMGKLGLMVALAIEKKGHQVKGYDVSPSPAAYLKSRAIPHKEEGAGALLHFTKIEMVSLQELCDWADIIFMAPQTPHDPKFEGATRLPSERADFDYTALKQCAMAVSNCLSTPKTCVVISTVLPGTMEREVLPIVGKNFKLVYEPLFIAMGTVLRDFLWPEFVLIGADSRDAAQELVEFYKTIHNAPVFVTDVRTAEGIKVFYNTFITMKTVLGNMYGEMAHKLGMNVDDIYEALSLAKDRLISNKYLKAGMGDGGGCHPRDNIALSYVARRVGLSFDMFDALMTAREKHAEWLADLIEYHRDNFGTGPTLPVCILGKAFKPNTNLDHGSPARLVSSILSERNIGHRIADEYPGYYGAALFFIGTQHEAYKDIKFPAGSVVIDPFRYIPDDPQIKLISIGAGRKVSAK